MVMGLFQLLKLYGGNKPLSIEQNSSGHSLRIFAVRFSPHNDDVILTGGWDDQIKFWDTRTATGVCRSIPGAHICGDALDIEGNVIVTGSWRPRDALQLWDYTEGRLIGNIPLNDAGETGEFLYCASFVQNDVVMVGGTGHSNLQLYNLLDRKLIGSISHNQSIYAAHSCKNQLAFGGAGNTLRVAEYEDFEP